MAIEKTAGDVRAQTELLVRHLANASGGRFSLNSFPSTTDIDTAIAVTQSEIFAWFAAFGYSTDPTAWTSAAKEYISWYNALGAGYRVEMAHTGLSFSPAPGTRAETYYNLYIELRKMLEAGLVNFGSIGIPILTGGGGNPQMSITGTSYSDKASLEQDADKLQAFFKRDGFKNPGISR